MEKQIRSKRREVGDGEGIDHKKLPYGRSGSLDRNVQIPFLQGIEGVNLFVSLRV